MCEEVAQIAIGLCKRFPRRRHERKHELADALIIVMGFSLGTLFLALWSLTKIKKRVKKAQLVSHGLTVTQHITQILITLSHGPSEMLTMRGMCRLNTRCV